MRLSLIGPGDIKFHYNKLLPNRGISLEIAKLYKKKGGKKVIGAFPKSDKTFGIEHLKQYINEKVEGKSLFDEIIDSGDWFKHDLIKGLLGQAVLYLGSSPGADGERHYAVYLYKLIQRFKDGIEISAKRIHPEIKAGNN